MKKLILILALLLLALQYRLWVGDGSVREIHHSRQQIEAQQQENQKLTARNERLRAEVQALRRDPAAVESQAREALGMVKRSETFYMLADE